MSSDSYSDQCYKQHMEKLKNKGRGMTKPLLALNVVATRTGAASKTSTRYQTPGVAQGSNGSRRGGLLGSYSSQSSHAASFGRGSGFQPRNSRCVQDNVGSKPLIPSLLEFSGGPPTSRHGYHDDFRMHGSKRPAAKFKAEGNIRPLMSEIVSEVKLRKLEVPRNSKSDLRSSNQQMAQIHRISSEPKLATKSTAGANSVTRSISPLKTHAQSRANTGIVTSTPLASSEANKAKAKFEYKLANTVSIIEGKPNTALQNVRENKNSDGKIEQPAAYLEHLAKLKGKGKSVAKCTAPTAMEQQNSHALKSSDKATPGTPAINSGVTKPPTSGPSHATLKFDSATAKDAQPTIKQVKKLEDTTGQSTVYLEHMAKLKGKSTPAAMSSPLTEKEQKNPQALKSPGKVAQPAVKEPAKLREFKMPAKASPGKSLISSKHSNSPNNIPVRVLATSKGSPVLVAPPTTKAKTGATPVRVPLAIKQRIKSEIDDGWRKKNTFSKPSDPPGTQKHIVGDNGFAIVPADILKQHLSSPTVGGIRTGLDQAAASNIVSKTQKSPAIKLKPNVPSLGDAGNEDRERNATKHFDMQTSPWSDFASPKYYDNHFNPSIKNNDKFMPVHQELPKAGEASSMPGDLPISDEEDEFVTLDSTYADDHCEESPTIDDHRQQHPKSYLSMPPRSAATTFIEEKTPLKGILKRTNNDSSRPSKSSSTMIPTKIERRDADLPTKVKPNLTGAEHDLIEVVPTHQQDGQDTLASMTIDNAMAAGLDFIHPVSGYHCVLCSTFYRDYPTALHHCTLLTHKLKVMKEQEITSPDRHSKSTNPNYLTAISNWYS